LTIESSEQKPTEGLTSKVVRGSAWIYGRGMVTSIINLGVMAILARNLTPADFGLTALASVILRFLAILASDGVGDYVIHDNKEGREERAQAAFWMDLALSSGVTLLGLACIPLITRFYSEPALGWILVALLLRYPIDSMAAVPDALLKKSLNFQNVAVRDTFLEIASGLGSVVLALTGWGVWSLIIPGLILSPIRVVIVFWLARWMPRLPLRLQLWHTVFNYSANIVGTNLANSIINEGDTLLIGKVFNLQELGLYNLAWQSANLVSRNITNTIGRLAMPALSAVSKEAHQLRTAYNRMFRYLAIASFPLLIGLFIIADLFIVTIYGIQWTPAILPLRILLIYAMRHSIGSSGNVIYNVLGKPQIGMQLSLIMIPFYLTSIWFGSRYGIVGVAAGVTLVRTTFGIVAFWLGSKLIGESLGKLLAQLLQPFIAACCMGLIVGIVRLGLNYFSIAPLIQLATLIIIGGLAYLALISTTFKQSLVDLLVLVDIFSPRLGRRVREITHATY
jgi:O-antigen/teichoic acid export membrane protein